MQKYKLSALFLMLVTNSVLAEDCSHYKNYTPYSSYHEYDVVQRNGILYECKVRGWCNQGGPYTPGIGWAWQQAWEECGYCQQDYHSSNKRHRDFYAGQHYAVGDVVFHRGEYYECKIAGWCSSPARAYEPGAGRAWYDAWRPYR